MGYGYVGNAAIDRAAAVPNGAYTYIELNVAATKRGNLVEAQLFVNNVGTNGFKVKIFRDDGTNYLYIGGSAALTLSTGLNTVAVTIPGVQPGDFIGVYVPSVAAAMDSVGSGTALTLKAGDITTDSLKSAWTSGGACTMSLYGLIKGPSAILAY